MIPSCRLAGRADAGRLGPLRAAPEREVCPRAGSDMGAHRLHVDPVDQSLKGVCRVPSAGPSGSSYSASVCPGEYGRVCSEQVATKCLLSTAVVGLRERNV